MKSKSQCFLLSLLLASTLLAGIPARSENGKSLLQQGLDALEDSHYATSVELFDRALKEQPNLVLAYIKRGNAKYILKQHQEALKDYDRAIQLDPQSIFAHARRGFLYHFGLGKKQEAKRDFDRALKLIPRSSQDYSEISRIFWYVKQDSKTALMYCDKALALDPENIRAYSIKAELHENKHEYESAIAIHHKILRILKNPSSSRRSETYQKIASIYAEQKKYSQALENINESIELDPKNSSGLSTRGSIFYEMEKYSEALKDFAAAIEIDPKDAWSYNWRGDIYYSQAKYQQAIAEYDRAIEHSPFSESWYTDRGNAKVQLARTISNKIEQEQLLRSAIADSRKAIAINPKNGWAYRLLGNAYEALQDNRNAMINYDKAIEIDPTGNEHLYIDRAFLKIALNLQESALADYQKVREIVKKKGDAKEIERVQSWIDITENTIDDRRTHPQRILLATIATLLLVGASYAGLTQISRRNQAQHRALANSPANSPE
jgi:tetratricopeptide (TPR) repeat protein